MHFFWKPNETMLQIREQHLFIVLLTLLGKQICTTSNNTGLLQTATVTWNVFLFFNGNKASSLALNVKDHEQRTIPALWGHTHGKEGLSARFCLS